MASVVVLHTPPTWDLAALPPEASGWPGVVKLFLEHGPLRAGVPTLSLISGYLVFSRPTGSRELIRRKLATLLVPFLVWNALVILLHRLTGQNDLAALLQPGQGLASWLGSLGGLIENPPDFPTYFLVDLFICTALAPLIGPLVRRAPLLTLLAGGLAAAYGWAPIPTVRPDISLAFIAGAAVAVHRLDPALLDRLWWQIGLFFLVLCGAFVAETAYHGSSRLPVGALRLVGVPAAWTLSAVLARTRLGRRAAGWSRFAFLVFCAHSPALHLLASLWPWDYWLFYATAAPLVIVAIVAVGMLLEARGGWVLGLLTGSRGPRPARAAALTPRAGAARSPPGCRPPRAPGP